MPSVVTVIALPKPQRGDNGQKDGRMDEVHHAVVAIVVVDQAFDAVGLSTQPSQVVILMVVCTCGSLP
jgi:hypothetical protein